MPVLLMLHGGGGSRAIALETACPAGDDSSPLCLHAMALDAGFLVVAPDGTPTADAGFLSGLKTWNGGGGDGGWQCVSGRACQLGVNEAAYFSSLLADLRTITTVDPTRVYATGLSNGGALSHRLACELPAVRAIASVAAGNQFATLEACTRRAAVLEIHGTNDPCWNYDGGAEACADPGQGIKIAVSDTMAGWASRNGCSAVPMSRLIADAGPTDPTAVIEHTWTGCSGSNDVVHLQVLNGGHTWPRGAEPRSGSSGLVSQAISANDFILRFFETH